ncbi:MAG: phosphoesterase [Clostridiales bacterium]|nr:phosphoesterase [Clostridiales bacterium]
MLYIFTAVLLTLILLFFALGIDNNITVTKYDIKSPKIRRNLKIAVISDLHSCDYGPNQELLMDKINNHSPDIIVMPGDIIDDKRPIDKTIEFFQEITKLYPCYYTTGNHEIRIDHLAYLKNVIKNHGIEVLDGKCSICNDLSICGIDDFELGEEVWYSQLNACSNTIESKHFNILLSHRPERVCDYTNCNFDLVIAGHAHGGQWRVPHILNGLYSPNQGLFPKYAGGKYTINKTVLVVSRGLAKENILIPRLYNPPELVIININ